MVLVSCSRHTSVDTPVTLSVGQLQHDSSVASYTRYIIMLLVSFSMTLVLPLTPDTSSWQVTTLRVHSQSDVESGPWTTWPVSICTMTLDNLTCIRLYHDPGQPDLYQLVPWPQTTWSVSTCAMTSDNQTCIHLYDAPDNLTCIHLYHYPRQPDLNQLVPRPRTTWPLSTCTKTPDNPTCINLYHDPG